MTTICVYLGAKLSNNLKIQQSAIALGETLSKQNINLVYGGSSLGLMGLLSNTMLKKSANVCGIITKNLLPIEKPSNDLTQLIIVDSMAKRKELMIEKADAFLVLPGGIGTLEEVFETLCAIKLRLINKPIGFLNIDGYFNFLFEFLKKSTELGFMKKEELNIPIIESDISLLLSALTKEL